MLAASVKALLPAWMLTCCLMASSQDAVRPLNTDRLGYRVGRTSQTDSLRQRRLLIGGLEAGFTMGSMVVLNKAWYTNYERGRFHFFNDWDEWMLMDKFGHALSTYSGCRVAGELWRWAGLDRKQAAWVSAASSMAYLTMVEVLDGYSEKWGFSTADMIFNAAGAGLYLGQELGWKEQRIMIKLSYQGIRHDPSYRGRTDALFGSSGIERFLKDYNAQTLWVSGNLKSFFPDSRIPPWLNLSLGHNARMMLGGRENRWTDGAGNVIDRRDVDRYRRFFLSLDVDLSRIPVKNRNVKAVLSLFNILKIPAPALEWDSRGRMRGHFMYY